MSDVDCNDAGENQRSDEVLSHDLDSLSAAMGARSSEAASGRQDVASVQIEPGQVFFAGFGRVLLELIQRRETDPKRGAIIPIDHPETDGRMLSLELWPGFLVKSERHGRFLMPRSRQMIGAILACRKLATAAPAPRRRPEEV
ncbi:hypothetical protein [Bosea sp. WAO]|uniref:hypothetical protein n=1 Tax=Bosea sp. WAO TaxID=406341 RepID=UPI000A6CA766|nr:hypothetical protein [Bosea sp. WAO]